MKHPTGLEVDDCDGWWLSLSVMEVDVEDSENGLPVVIDASSAAGGELGINLLLVTHEDDEAYAVSFENKRSPN